MLDHTLGPGYAELEAFSEGNSERGGLIPLAEMEAIFGASGIAVSGAL